MAPAGTLPNIQFFRLCSCEHNRKNWLFANTEKGAKTTAVLYSLNETAKANGMNPYDYLTHVFKTAPNSDFSTNPATLERLLPLQLYPK